VIVAGAEGDNRDGEYGAASVEGHEALHLLPEMRFVVRDSINWRARALADGS